jgi:hypothetical protein
MVQNISEICGFALKMINFPELKNVKICTYMENKKHTYVVETT